ncbi:MAG TPA: hypothetical protein VFF26_06555 [Gallionella sp.]|nr:hypothetical protein [Gallionella sp.]
MKLHDAHLRSLNEQFRAQQQTLGFSVRTFAETHGVFVGRKIFGLSFGPRVVVVDPSSSDPNVPGETVIRLPEDHFSICKPANRSSQIHKSLVGFLRALPTSTLDQQLPNNVVTPTASEISLTEENVGPAFPKPLPTEMALAEVGLRDDAAPLIVTTCLVTDEPRHLADEIDNWKNSIARNPLLPEATRKRLHKEDLTTIFSDATARTQLLGWLAVTSFSAYVYYGYRSEIAKGVPPDLKRLFIINPLVHRLSKKSELILAVHGDLEDLSPSVENACQAILDQYGRKVDSPTVKAIYSDRISRALKELAHLVATAVVRHLTTLGDHEEAILFEHIRTRIRFAENVLTGEKHTRDKNPLP